LSDAPIEIVAYNTDWPSLFERERGVLQRALAPWLAGPPEHIGSTAVPGLSAKPVIDIMAPIGSLEAALPAISAAQHAGYVHYPYKPESMHWFCKPSPSHRTHHLHLVPAGSALWRENLVFRDALRADRELRAEYQALKIQLASAHRNDREAYTNAKSAFIGRVVQSVGG